MKKSAIDKKNTQKGIWKKIFRCAIKSAHKQNKLNLQKISVDSSSIHSKKVATQITSIFNNGFMVCFYLQLISKPYNTSKMMQD